MKRERLKALGQVISDEARDPDVGASGGHRLR